MESDAAYEAIKQWARGFRLVVQDTADPIGRVQELALAAAALRLSPIFSDPQGPDFEAVRALMRDYFAANKSNDPGGSDERERIGTALETLVQAAVQQKVAALENRPYFGCHRTADSRPPAAHSLSVWNLPHENLKLETGRG